MKIRTYMPVYKKAGIQIDLHEVDLEKGLFRYTIYYNGEYKKCFYKQVKISDWTVDKYLDLNWKQHPIQEILTESKTTLL